MAISLYDASIRAFLQTLGAIDGFLGKGLAHCRENGVDPEELVEARIFPDMHPLRFQIQNVFIFSVGAIEAIKNGEMRRPSERPQQNYAELQALVAEARKKLEHVTPDEINAREGAEVVQEARDTKRHFTAEDFLFSFALPNFYFHATTAYDILRMKGVPLGKRDFMGVLRTKG
ncbi:MAG TPA: DUF1993 domain-containing protein [Methylovirgula sp.]|nr:DUF1993 domain-containing protein [Methylovirgula sp.]